MCVRLFVRFKFVWSSQSSSFWLCSFQVSHRSFIGLSQSLTFLSGLSFRSFSQLRCFASLSNRVTFCKSIYFLSCFYYTSLFLDENLMKTYSLTLIVYVTVRMSPCWLSFSQQRKNTYLYIFMLKSF